MWGVVVGLVGVVVMVVGEVVDMVVDEVGGTMVEEVVDMALEGVLKDLSHQIGNLWDYPNYMYLL